MSNQDLCDTILRLSKIVGYYKVDEGVLKSITVENFRIYLTTVNAKAEWIELLKKYLGKKLKWIKKL